jgi:molecular chaperone GrpE
MEQSNPEPQPAADPAERSREAGVDSEAVDQDLDALLGDVTRERDEYLELAQRTRADFENYKKRVARESAEAERRGKAKLVRELLPVVDNLERALEAEAGDSSLAEGVRLVYRELRDALDRLGVEAYEPVGEKFDPSLHEALSTRGEQGDPGLVLEVVDKGYRLNGQVLRPARVVVSE